MQVKEFMNENVKSVVPKTTIQKAVEMMNKNRISCIIIEDNDGEILGIVTESDIIKSIAKKIPTSKAIEIIMTKKVIVVEPETDLSEAIDIMVKHGIKKLPVVNEGELVGIITTSDIMKNLDEYSEELVDKIGEVFEDDE